MSVEIYTIHVIKCKHRSVRMLHVRGNIFYVVDQSRVRFGRSDHTTDLHIYYKITILGAQNPHTHIDTPAVVTTFYSVLKMKNVNQTVSNAKTDNWQLKTFACIIQFNPLNSSYQFINQYTPSIYLISNRIHIDAIW